MVFFFRSAASRRSRLLVLLHLLSCFRAVRVFLLVPELCVLEVRRAVGFFRIRTRRVPRMRRHSSLVIGLSARDGSIIRSSTFPSLLITFTTGATWYPHTTGCLVPVSSGNVTGLPALVVGLKSADAGQSLEKSHNFRQAIPLDSMILHMACAREKQQSTG